MNVQIVEFVPEACDCARRIREFFATRQASGFPNPGPGTRITCECGRNYILSEPEGGVRSWELQA